MDTLIINVMDILVDESRFSPRGYLFESFNAPTCHLTSFDSLGILYPIIVFKDNRERFHLVDGRKRVQFAREMKQPVIRANVLPGSTPVTDIITLVFCNKRVDIEASAINKVQFLNYALTLNAGDEWIIQHLCIPFEFKPHSTFLSECERINRLPGVLKEFCHDKKFSLKQLLNLAYYPDDVLKQVIDWMPHLQFTASTMDEVAANLRDYLRRNNRPAAEFSSDDDVQEIFDSSLSPREKTERLRLLLNYRKYPVLSEKNAVIQEAVDRLNLPRGVSIDWDRTLENKNIALSVNLNDPGQWEEIMKRLGADDLREAIRNILDEL